MPSPSSPAESVVRRICWKRTSGLYEPYGFCSRRRSTRIWSSRGASLSKAYGVIRRFSEDIDITYVIRAFAPELTAGTDEPLPVSRSQEQRWTRAIRSELAVWTREHALPVLQAGLAESGARSTGDPRALRLLECEAAVHLPDIAFPTASPSVMLAERTFWEKATAMHVFCLQLRRRAPGSPDTGTTWFDWTMLDMLTWRSQTVCLRFRSRATSRSSLQKRLPTADGSTTKQLSRVPCSWCRPVRLTRRSPKITKGCWLAACSSTTKRDLMKLRDAAPILRREPMRARSIPDLTAFAEMRLSGLDTVTTSLDTVTTSA